MHYIDIFKKRDISRYISELEILLKKRNYFLKKKY